MRQEKGKLTLPFFLTSTLECRTFSLFALTGFAAFYADFSCMTFAFFVIHTFCRLAVDTAAGRRIVLAYVAV